MVADDEHLVVGCHRHRVVGCVDVLTVADEHERDERELRVAVVGVGEQLSDRQFVVQQPAVQRGRAGRREVDDRAVLRDVAAAVRQVHQDALGELFRLRHRVFDEAPEQRRDDAREALLRDEFGGREHRVDAERRDDRRARVRLLAHADEQVLALELRVLGEGEVRRVVARTGDETARATDVGVAFFRVGHDDVHAGAMQVVRHLGAEVVIGGDDPRPARFRFVPRRQRQVARVHQPRDEPVRLGPLQREHEVGAVAVARVDDGVRGEVAHAFLDARVGAARDDAHAGAQHRGVHDDGEVVGVVIGEGEHAVAVLVGEARHAEHRGQARVRLERGHLALQLVGHDAVEAPFVPVDDDEPAPLEVEFATDLTPRLAVPADDEERLTDALDLRAEALHRERVLKTGRLQQ